MSDGPDSPGTIVLAGSRYYLALPLFSAIARASTRWRSVFLDLRESGSGGSGGAGPKPDADLLAAFSGHAAVEDAVVRAAMEAKTVWSRVRATRRLNEVLVTQLADLNPSAIVVVDDVYGPTARLCNHWADRCGVPFVVMQAVPLKLKTRGRASLGSRLRRRAVNALAGLPVYNRQTHWGQESPRSYAFLWGEYFKAQYEAAGKNVSRFKVVGNPMFDAFRYDREWKAEQKRVYLEQEGLPITPAAPLVAVCTQPLTTAYEAFGPQEWQSIYGMVRQTVIRRPDAFFILKVHPREDPARYAALFGDVPHANYRIVHRHPIERLLIAADVQMSSYSTTSLQALVYGTPVILLRTSAIDAYYEGAELFEMAAAVKAASVEELDAALRVVTTPGFVREFGPRRATFIERTVHAVDGRSGARFFQALDEVRRARAAVAT